MFKIRSGTGFVIFLLILVIRKTRRKIQNYKVFFVSVGTWSVLEEHSHCIRRIITSTCKLVQMIATEANYLDLV